jgi:predicted nucleic acid-binding protein
MIAADTSTWIAFFQGQPGEDVELLDGALKSRQVVMVPPVLSELLSDPGISKEISKTIAELPLIELQSGFWERAGLLRAKALAKDRKARLGDALIAQSCLDEGIPLLTRDHDFRAFAALASLNVLLEAGG